MESRTQTSNLDPQLVSIRAYEIWESLGRPEGAAERTWLEAVRQLSSAAETTTPQSDSSRANSEPTHSEPAHSEARAENVRSSAPPASDPPSSPNATNKDKKSNNNHRRARR